METLTEIVSARVDKKMARRITQEVKARRKNGNRVNGADITREALIEHFAQQDANKSGAKP